MLVCILLMLFVHCRNRKLLLFVAEHPEENKGRDKSRGDGLQGLGFSVKGTHHHSLTFLLLSNKFNSTRVRHILLEIWCQPWCLSKGFPTEWAPQWQWVIACHWGQKQWDTEFVQTGSDVLSKKWRGYSQWDMTMINIMTPEENIGFLRRGRKVCSNRSICIFSLPQSHTDYWRVQHRGGKDETDGGVDPSVSDTGVWQAQGKIRINVSAIFICQQLILFGKRGKCFCLCSCPHQAIPIISQTRYLEKKGELQEMSKGGTLFNMRAKFNPVHLFLFNDLLVIAVKKRWGMKTKPLP